MTIEIQASFRSVEASYTSIQASSERNTLAIEQRGNRPPPPALNNQQQQIVDEVGISQEAIAQFEEDQILAEQLQGYLNYLNGNREESNLVQIIANDNESDVTISGSSSRLSASIEVATYTEETLDINATFDDAGNLTDLSVSQTTITAEHVRAELILEERQFFAQAA